MEFPKIKDCPSCGKEIQNDGVAEHDGENCNWYLCKEDIKVHTQIIMSQDMITSYYLHFNYYGLTVRNDFYKGKVDSKILLWKHGDLKEMKGEWFLPTPENLLYLKKMSMFRGKNQCQ